MIQFHHVQTESSDIPDISGLSLCLTMEQRTRSRLKVTLSDGRDAGLFLPRGTVLKEGDVLVSSDQGEQVVVLAAEEQVSTVHSNDHLLMARACYHLGNRHVPLQIGDGWCRYLHDHVLDDMVTRLGLEVRVEIAKYQPEPGAYGGSSGNVSEKSGSSHHHHH